MDAISLRPPTSNTIDARPTLQINTAALRENLGYVRRVIGAMPRLYAVVKANAYGHGVGVVAPAVRDRVDGFVVVTIDEAHALRRVLGDDASPILVLQPIEPDIHAPATLDAAIAGGFTLSPGSIDGLRAIAAAARRVGRVAPLLMHLDTGLRRCGLDLDAAHVVAAEAIDSPHLQWTDVSTHCAFQDGADAGVTRSQLDAFAQFVDAWRPRVPGLIAHAAASGLALLDPSARFDAVRIGAAMYGIDPLDRIDTPLRPAMRLVAPIVALRDVMPGDGVGYGHTFIADRPGRLALLPVGYFDGYPRAASNRTSVVIDGVACPTVGTISMDLLIADVTDCPSATLGTAAVVIDDAPRSPASAAALAQASATVTYEIVSRLGSARVRRAVVDQPATETVSKPRVEYVRRSLTPARTMRCA